MTNNDQPHINRYDVDKDAKAVAQIWLECGWIEELGAESSIVRKYLEASQDALVARVDDQQYDRTAAPGPGQSGSCSQNARYVRRRILQPRWLR